MQRLLAVPLTVILSFFITACGGGGGGGGSAPPPPPKGTLKVTVEASADSMPVEGAIIEVYNDVGERIRTATSNAEGVYTVKLRPKGYTVRVRAQGFESSPPSGVPAVPVQVLRGKTVTKPVSLSAFGDANATAYVSGNAGAPGALVIIEETTTNAFYSAVADGNGDYVIYNLLPGTYDFSAYLKGFDIAPVASVALNDPDMTQDLVATAQTGYSVSGQITFLSVTNGTVDITLLHPETRDVIPGLTVTNNANNNYAISGVANGIYLAWASLANDGYVMDPDWIIKNGGIPDAIQVTIADAGATQDFSVTRAITLTSPTNTQSNLTPEIVDTLTPTLSWQAYSSAGEYIVEVFDKDGNSIFGGYDVVNAVTGEVAPKHADITTTSMLISSNNMDDYYVPLEDGETYRWKVSAVKVSPDHSLISSSEDLMGVFTVAIPAP